MKKPNKTIIIGYIGFDEQGRVIISIPSIDLDKSCEDFVIKSIELEKRNG